MKTYDEMRTTEGLPWLSQESQDYLLRSPNVERNKEAQKFASVGFRWLGLVPDSYSNVMVSSFSKKIMLFTMERNNLRVHFTNLARSGQKTPEVENTRNNIPLVWIENDWSRCDEIILY